METFDCGTIGRPTLSSHFVSPHKCHSPVGRRRRRRTRRAKRKHRNCLQVAQSLIIQSWSLNCCFNSTNIALLLSALLWDVVNFLESIIKIMNDDEREKKKSFALLKALWSFDRCGEPLKSCSNHRRKLADSKRKKEEKFLSSLLFVYKSIEL